MIPLSRPMLGELEYRAAARVLRSGNLAQGRQVAAFEREFARFVQCKHVVAVNSGTAALHLGLMSAGIGPGDEVIVPSFTFAATANAVRLAGARPVFVDIERDTFCIDPQAAAAAIRPATAAIIAVHLFGHMADMEPLVGLAEKHRLLLVEDAAQAHGASIDGVPAGAWGHVAAFSFYATKNMTCGEGGAIAIRDPAHDRTARLLRNQGMLERYHNETVGYNARLTEVAAAIARVQLRRLPELNSQRRENARAYDLLLDGVGRPSARDRYTHVYHQYTVTSDRRDEVVSVLRRRGIDTGIFYPIPVHLLPSFADSADVRVSDVPITTQVCKQVLSLPVGPHIGKREVVSVSDAVRTA